MRCEYCDVEVTTYPETGICIHCGGKLPPKPASAPPVPAHAGTQTGPAPVQQVRLVPGFNCCPKCRDMRIFYVKRGFRWGLGILGFFLIPVLGLLLGFCGSGKSYLRCSACGHKWKRG